MEIELTSARDDDTFTWRAAGARQPRGVVPNDVLPSGSKVGDVLRAEVEVEIDGITVVSILPPRQKAGVEGLIEYIGPERPQAGVTTVLASKADRRGRGDRDRFDRPRDGERSRPREGRPGDRQGGSRTEGRDRQSTSEAGTSERPRRDDRSRGDRSASPAGGRGRAQGAERPTGTRGAGSARTTGPRPDSGGQRRTGDRHPSPESQGARRGPARFQPGTAHRDELLARLSPEERTIAERLAMGGLPSVRKALLDEQVRARSEGRPVVSGEPIIAIAEQLLPDVKAAVWLDRAEAAVTHADEMSLRELRSTVVAASPRDEAGRALERQLREALERRITKLRHDWEAHLTQALDDGRVLQALRLSAKPPEPTARFPAALVMRLAEQAGQAMTADTAPDRWLALLEAASLSPVRRQIKPAGMPKDATGEVERKSRAAASRVPALAKLLGMAIPPPPKPVPTERPHRGGGPPTKSSPAQPTPEEPRLLEGSGDQTAREPVASEPEPVASEPEPVAAEPEPEPVPSEPEPVAAEPEPVAVEPQPVASEPEPVASEPELPEADTRAELPPTEEAPELAPSAAVTELAAPAEAAEEPSESL